MLFPSVQAIGTSNEHLEFPGTLTVSDEMVIRAWREIGESVHRAGMRKLVLVTSQGGDIPALDIVARELRVRLGVLAVVVSPSRFGCAEGLFGAGVKVHGIHAGEAETSPMLAFRPELVRRAAKGEAARDSGADAFVDLLRDVQRLDVGRLAKGPLASGQSSA